MNQNSKNNLGQLGEVLVQRIYHNRGFKIISRNFFNRKGKRFSEIDFIAAKPGHIHFVEVKTRASSKYGSGLEAISMQKQRKILKGAAYFLTKFPKLQELKPHIDVAIVQVRAVDKKRVKVTIYSDAIDGNC